MSENKNLKFQISELVYKIFHRRIKQDPSKTIIASYLFYDTISKFIFPKLQVVTHLHL